MAEKTINVILKEKNTYILNLNYVNSTSDRVYLMPLNINDEDLIKNKFDSDEIEMFDQIKRAQEFGGSSMLVMLGLRSLIESLINKICVKNKISTWVIIKKDGRGETVELKLTAKFIKIRPLIKDCYAKETIFNIITKANLVAHELLNELQQNSSEKYLKDFIIIIKTEDIFNNLNKKNESTITTTNSN
jgi:hypothetical protein